MFDKGDPEYVALNAIEEFVRDKGYRLGLGADDGILGPFGRPWATSRLTLPKSFLLRRNDQALIAIAPCACCLGNEYPATSYGPIHNASAAVIPQQ